MSTTARELLPPSRSGTWWWTEVDHPPRAPAWRRSPSTVTVANTITITITLTLTITLTITPTLNTLTIIITITITNTITITITITTSTVITLWGCWGFRMLQQIRYNILLLWYDILYYNRLPYTIIWCNTAFWGWISWQGQAGTAPHCGATGNAGYYYYYYYYYY